MSNTLRIKQRYGIPDGTKGKQAIAKLIRSHVDGGNELIDALTRLSEYMHSQRRPEQDTLEIAKAEMNKARELLGGVFFVVDDAIEAASNAQDALAELKAQRGHLGPVLHDIYTWLGKALEQMDAPLRLTAGWRPSATARTTPRPTVRPAPQGERAHPVAPASDSERVFLPAPDEVDRQGKKRPSSHDWSKVDFGRPSADIAAEMGVSVQAVNKQRRKLAPDLPRAPIRAPKRR